MRHSWDRGECRYCRAREAWWRKLFSCRPKHGQSTWCWCPGCDRDLIGRTGPMGDVRVLAEGDGNYQYWCSCGAWSRWLFGITPNPILKRWDPKGKDRWGPWSR